MPPYEEYIDMIKPLWETHILTNMGIYHAKLEESLKQYLEVENLSLMTNGHMALELSMQALNLSGEVITTPFTFASTVHAIKRNNLTPVFCDINETDFTIDVNKIERLINKNTSAIVPVHVFGNVCNVEAIDALAKKYGLHVVYDASHTFGEQYKGKHVASYGEIATLSFHATKVYNTVEGGAVVFNSGEIGDRLYSLKNFGIRSEEIIDGIGANAKMDEFRAIMGLCNLFHIEEEIARRKRVYEKYTELLNGIEGLLLPKVQKDIKANYAYFPIVLQENVLKMSRNEVCSKLRDKNIYARKYFYPLMNNTACYRNQYGSNDTPIAKEISESIMTLPIYADLKIDEVEFICRELRNILRNAHNDYSGIRK